MGAHNRPMSERLSNVMPITECGCHIWMGGTGGPLGYGAMKVNGKAIATHRLSWEESYGDIPDGMWVLHKCDIPTCINPEHLFLGDHNANMEDKRNKKRAPYGEGHHSTKITSEDALAIRESNQSSKVLAALFNLNASSIRNIRNGKRWKYLENAR